jgi:hypothetical protein
MSQTVPLLYTTYAGMDMGRDNGGVVDLADEVSPTRSKLHIPSQAS